MKTKRTLDNILEEVGLRLSELREKNGYRTLKEFVQEHDLPEVQYWRIEKGKANITLKSLVKILSIHKVTLQDFFCLVNHDGSRQRI